MPITTKVVSSNPAHGKVYSMQYYVIKFVISGFPLDLRFPPSIKLTFNLYCRDYSFQLFNWLLLFSSENCFPKVALHGQNRSKMTILKGGVDGFSYFSLISVILFSNQDTDIEKIVLFRPMTLIFLHFLWFFF